MSFSHSNTITDNVLVNVVDPIGAGDNGTVARNTMVNGIDAIGVSSYSRIYDNSISDFSESGLDLGGVDSTIYENTVTNCSYAVLMSGSSDYYPFGNNTLYHNNFVNNSEPLLLLGNSSLSINYWDNGKEGNYWSSYNGTGNGDGIGATPYNLGGNNIDLYPLLQPYVPQSAIIDYSMGRLFFTLAIITAAAGAVISLCLYIKYKTHR
jgi:nitrous oxidase accessory protein NosD